MTRISLDEARDRIAEAFKRIDLSQNQRILVNAPVATGKTRAAAELCQRAADQGISSLVLVPLHALGKEWIEASSKADLPADRRSDNRQRLSHAAHSRGEWHITYFLIQS